MTVKTIKYNDGKKYISIDDVIEQFKEIKKQDNDQRIALVCDSVIEIMKVYKKQI